MNSSYTLGKNIVYTHIFTQATNLPEQKQSKK